MLYVQKEAGDKEVFSEQKLCDSILAAGAPKDLAFSVCRIVRDKLPNSPTTTHVFRRTLHYLVKENLDVAAKYSLRRGLEMLGPAGFLFEQYIEAVFQAHGYKTKRDQFIMGECITHEIDVVLEKEGHKTLVEAKYRNEVGIKTHVDVVMYAEARRQDIEIANKGQNFEMLVVTNTKFTETAIKYAECKHKIKLLGWNYPKGASLEKIIEEKKVYPVTVLPFVTKTILQQFAEKSIILIEDLIPYTIGSLAKDFSLTETKARQILSQVREIMK